MTGPLPVRNSRRMTNVTNLNPAEHDPGPRKDVNPEEESPAHRTPRQKLSLTHTLQIVWEQPSPPILTWISTN